jgi:hypothetical protein
LLACAARLKPRLSKPNKLKPFRLYAERDNAAPLRNTGQIHSETL